MKVGTDSMLLGAFVEINGEENLLDIGAGTGVLSLMLAQKSSDLAITAVEIDENAVEDLKTNCSHSPFSNDFHILHSDFLEMEENVKFDCIVSNPPFYKDSFSVNDTTQRAKARNEIHLPFPKLIAKASRLLSDDGSFWMIFPAQYQDEILRHIEQKQLFVNQKISLYSKPDFLSRMIVCVKRFQNTIVLKESLTIRDENGHYTSAYIARTKDYHAKDLG